MQYNVPLCSYYPSIFYCFKAWRNLVIDLGISKDILQERAHVQQTQTVKLNNYYHYSWCAFNYLYSNYSPALRKKQITRCGHP